MGFVNSKHASERDSIISTFFWIKHTMDEIAARNSAVDERAVAPWGLQSQGNSNDNELSTQDRLYQDMGQVPPLSMDLTAWARNPLRPPPANQCHIASVPREVMFQIFGFLENMKDLASVSCTCKDWNNTVWDCVKKICVTLRRRSPWSSLEKMTRIQTLEIDAGNSCENLQQVHINDVVTHMTSLKKLCVERATKTIRFHQLKNITKLKSLSLYDCLNLENISFLTEMTNVKKLCLSKCLVGDSGLQAVATMTSLEHLYLWHTHITDEGMSRLTNLTNLKVLDVSGNPYITDKGIENFAKLENLQMLDTSNTQVSLVGLFALKKHSPRLQIGYKELYGNPLMRRTKKLKLFQ